MKRLIFIFSLLLICTSVLPQKRFSKNRNGAFKGSIQDYCRGSYNFSCELMSSYTLSFALWQLMGEPMRDFKFTWELNESAIIYLEDSPYSVSVYQLKQYPDLYERLKKIKPLPDLELSALINFYDDKGMILHHHMSIDINIDLPDLAGVTSFSVPDSPDWQDIFGGTAEMNKQLLNSAQEISLESLSISKIEWPEHELNSIAKEYLCREKKLEECKEEAKQDSLIAEAEEPEAEIVENENNEEDILAEIENTLEENKRQEADDLWDEIEIEFNLKQQQLEEQRLAEEKRLEEEPDWDYFTDSRDGQTYKTVKIGDQVWMAENLKAIRYPNGRPIPMIKEKLAWRDDIDMGDDACCYYNNDKRNIEYGVLYTWTAAMGGNIEINTSAKIIQGVCPTGWHLPSNSEWSNLRTFLAKQTDLSIGEVLMSNEGWKSTGGSGIDKYGFCALPSGTRGSRGHFEGLGQCCIWWSATESSKIHVWIREIGGIYDNFYPKGASYKSDGLSVRCIKD